MAIIFSDEYKLLDLATADGVGIPLDLKQHKTISLVVVVTGTYDGTLTFPASNSDSLPDFSQPADDTNRYTPRQVVDTDSGNFLAGSSGIDFSAAPYSADGVYSFEVNTNGQFHGTAKVANATQGTIKVYARFYDNN